jgi:hypothetical protein
LRNKERTLTKEEFVISKPKGSCPNVLIDSAPAPAKFAMRLCNFATGQARLLHDHQRELSSRIIDAAWPHQGGWIDIVGYASKLGDADKNLRLSNARCDSVKAYLAPHLDTLGSRFRFNVIMGRGEEESQNDPTGNDGFFRAVIVRLFAQGQYKWEPPPKPKPVPLPVQPADRFEFQAIQVTSGNIKLGQADVVEFSIRDVKNGRIRYFMYVAGGGAIPTPGPPVGASVSRNSNVVGFVTKVPINEFEKFEADNSDATFLQDAGAALGGASMGGACTLKWTPRAYKDRSINAKIELTFSTSKGIGFSGGSGTIGRIVKLPDSYRPQKFPGE